MILFLFYNYSSSPLGSVDRFMIVLLWGEFCLPVLRIPGLCESCQLEKENRLLLSWDPTLQKPSSEEGQCSLSSTIPASKSGARAFHFGSKLAKYPEIPVAASQPLRCLHLASENGMKMSSPAETSKQQLPLDFAKERSHRCLPMVEPKEVQTKKPIPKKSLRGTDDFCRLSMGDVIVTFKRGSENWLN